MKRISYILIIISLLTGCNAPLPQQEKSSDYQGIKRKFMFKLFNNGVEIYLKEDFSFMNFSYSFGCIGGYRVKKVLGEYTIKDNHIFFTPQKMTWEEDWGKYYFEPKTVSIDTVDYFYTDTTKIQLNYWHLKKDNFEFLISETPFNEQDEYFILSSNYIALANLYNSNFEDKICKSVFCNIDTIVNIRNILSKEDIPNEFQLLFIDQPIEITVKKVKVNKINDELCPIYTVTSEKNDDIFIGMKFYSKKHPDFPITIIDKQEGILTAQGYDIFDFNTKLQIGTILSSERQ